MSKSVKAKSLNAPPLSGWDRAIYDATRLIYETNSKLLTLKAALSHFRERKNSGEPFPGSEIRAEQVKP